VIVGDEASLMVVMPTEKEMVTKGFFMVLQRPRGGAATVYGKNTARHKAPKAK
jgi:hypothetical protein